MSDLIGKTLGGYRIIEQIGLGGMATVFKAYQPSMDRYVAFKVISTHLTRDPTFLKRFQQEAKVIAKLEHPHILPVHDYGEEDGYLYLVMRFVEGGTLKDRLERGDLSLEEARHIVAQVGSALEYAHQRGVVHRDLKPSNVLIDPRGDCYLSDFGIAKMVESTLGLTGPGVLGTPHYMAPEQSQSLEVDRRTDVYAMGVVIYEMVTGQVPFDAETPFAVAMKHISEPLPLPRRIKPDLPEGVERIILKALAKDPADRYQNMRDLVAGFERAVGADSAPLPALGADVEARPVTALPLPVSAASEAAPHKSTGGSPMAPLVQRRGAPQRAWLIAGAGLALVVPLLVILAVAGVILDRTKLSSGPTQVELEAASTPVLGATPAQLVGEIVQDTPTREPTTSPPAISVVTEEPSNQPTQSLVTSTFAQPVSTPTAPSTVSMPTQPLPTPTVPPTASTPPAALPSLPVGGWQPVPDLPRQVNSLVVDPTDPQVLYAGTGESGAGSGVYKSEDGGVSWHPAMTGLPNQDVLALAISRDVPSTLYAAIGKDVFASTDGAQSWTHLGDSSTISGFYRQLYIAPSASDVLFMVIHPGGLIRSNDGGYSWLPVGEGLPGDEHEVYVLSLAIDPTDADVVYVGTGAWVGGGHGVYKSTDGGETFSPANRGMLDYRISVLAVDPAQPQTVYAGGDSGELFKSTDGGQTWIELTDNLRVQRYSEPRTIRGIVVDPAAPETVYLLGDNAGVMVSQNEGEKWRPLGKPGEHDQPVFTAWTVAFTPRLVLVVGVEREGGWRTAN